MKLILEEADDIEFLIETNKETGKRTHYIQGPFLESEEKNRNGRIYPRRILENEVRRYNQEYISKNRALGECGHPETPSINLDRVSHMITSLTPDGNKFIGKAKVLDTPMGNIVKGLLDGGASLGVSSRGVGSLKPQNGYQLVQEDYKLATVDVVADPSAKSAMVQGLMEGADWIYEGGVWTQQHLEKAKKTIRLASKSRIEEVSLNIFENLISKIRNT